MSYRYLTLIVYFLFIGIIFVPGLVVNAAGSTINSPTLPSLPASAATFGDLIQYIYTYSFYLLGVAVFVAILYAGFLWLTAAGDSGKISKAKDVIGNTVIGAVLLVLAFVILNTINPDLTGGGFTLPGIPGGLGIPGGGGGGAPTYGCDLNQQCVAMPSGAFFTNDCDNTCPGGVLGGTPVPSILPAYGCNINLQCVPQVGGPYSVPNCLNACTNVSGPRYGCDANKQCVAMAGGGYSVPGCFGFCNPLTDPGIGSSTFTPLPAPGAPQVSLTASTITVILGDSITLNWSTVNAGGCAAASVNGDFSGTKPTSGAQTVSPTTDTQYGIACANGGGQASSIVTITVITIDLSITPTTITAGASATIDWSSTNTVSCFASGGWSGTKDVAGSEIVSPTSSTTYSLRCTPANGVASRDVSVSITVLAPPPPPPPATNFDAVVLSAVHQQADVTVPDVTWSDIQLSNTGTAPWVAGEESFACAATSGWTFSLLATEFVTGSPVLPGQTATLRPVLQPISSGGPLGQLVPVSYSCQLTHLGTPFGGSTGDITFNLVQN